MKKYLPILSRCPLFEGVAAEELSAMLGCLGARITERRKNEPILLQGDPARQVGILLAGSAQIVKNDFYGNRSIVASIQPTQLFGETFACAGVDCLPISVIATENSEIMLIDCRRIISSCSNACAFHNRLIFNLLRVVAAKNLLFHQKLEITAKRTTREKLMAYLMEQAREHNASEFTIPFDRQALADYLGVERSALSAEIGKLRDEGVLERSRSRFTLKRGIPEAES